MFDIIKIQHREAFIREAFIIIYDNIMLIPENILFMKFINWKRKGNFDMIRYSTIGQFICLGLFSSFFSVRLLSVLRGHSFFYRRYNGQ